MTNRLKHLIFLGVFVLCLCLTTGTTGWTADTENVSSGQEKLPDEMIQTVDQLARQDIREAVLENGQRVEWDADEEKTKAILPFKDVRRLVERGVLSEWMNQCGADWREDFRWYMKRERRKRRWTPKQRAYMMLLHRTSMEWYRFHPEIIRQSQECPAFMETAFN
ncbi:MAG: hypothetical protein KTR14_03845 [Vampirovibrio sp.]|nr:hypothetical protein [Vampirovibrio sp.]